MNWIHRLRGILGGIRDGAPEEHDGSGMPGYSCEEALARLFEWLDGELEGEEEDKVEKHFDVCARCYPLLTQERAFREAMERVRSGDPPPPDLRKRVLETLKENGFRPS